MVMLITPKKNVQREAHERKLALKSNCEKRQRLSQTLIKMAAGLWYSICEELVYADAPAMLIMANQLQLQQQGDAKGLLRKSGRLVSLF